jgi:hypothetical protein
LREASKTLRDLTAFEEFLFLSDLHHFQAAKLAPSAGNRVYEIAAEAPHFQCTGERVWRAFLALLRGLIFKDNNHVHVGRRVRNYIFLRRAR